MLSNLLKFTQLVSGDVGISVTYVISNICSSSVTYVIKRSMDGGRIQKFN